MFNRKLKKSFKKWRRWKTHFFRKYKKVKTCCTSTFRTMVHQSQCKWRAGRRGDGWMEGRRGKRQEREGLIREWTQPTTTNIKDWVPTDLCRQTTKGTSVGRILKTCLIGCNQITSSTGSSDRRTDLRQTSKSTDTHRHRHRGTHTHTHTHFS